MDLTEEDIQKFEAALQGPAPDWDPDWKISKALIELVRAQTEENMKLQAQLAVSDFSEAGAIAALTGALKGGLEAKVHPGNLEQKDVDAAVASLKSAVQAAQNGQQIVKYAGHVLRFVSKVIL